MTAHEDIRGENAGHLQPALVAIVGKSDSGKTTLIEKVVPELVRLGLRVGTVKHDAHSFEIDHPGKDSWRHGQAGAEAYVIASPGAPRLHHQARRRAARSPRSSAATTTASTSSSPRATSAPPRTASSSSASARGTPSRSARPARRSPSSPTRTWSTSTASASRTAPASPRSWPPASTPCASTEKRGFAVRRSSCPRARAPRRTVALAERRIPLDIAPGRMDDARDAVELIRIADYLVGAPRAGHRARLRVSDHGEVRVWRRT